MTAPNAAPHLIFHDGSSVLAPPSLERAYAGPEGKPVWHTQATLGVTDLGELKVHAVGGAHIEDVALFGSYIALVCGQQVEFEFNGLQGPLDLVIPKVVPQWSAIRASLKREDRGAMLQRFDTVKTPETLNKREKLAVGIAAKVAVMNYTRPRPR